uniref:Uncharacterized protein n=1 Tax=Avena sativa TaxID=4498 RepID=A0ACD5WI20_AVESA
MGLQKSLVDILHEHNNDYHRAQNGWSGDTWNLMTKIFKDRNKHVNFTKSQLQDQEKELKRQYCMLKEARKQSGAGWCEKSCRIQADDALWDNLLISFPKIGKFKKYDFPLFDRLGDLYDGKLQRARTTSPLSLSHHKLMNKMKKYKVWIQMMMMMIYRL